MNQRRRAAEDWLALLGRTRVQFLIYDACRPPHTFFLQVGVEPGVPRHQLRHLAPFALLRFYRRHVRTAAAQGTEVAWAGPSTPAALSPYRSELAA